MANKPIYQSRTFWANVITTLTGMLGVLAGADWMAEHPKIVAGIVTAIGLLNVFLRAITVDPVSLKVLLLCLLIPAGVEAQVMEASKEARLRGFIPQVGDVPVLNAKIAQAMLYTEEEIPKVIQDQPLSGGSGVGYTIFRSVYQQVNGSRLPTNGGRDFPWGTPGGMHGVDKDWVYAFRFVWVPQDRPIVVYRTPLERSSRINMPSPVGWRWIAPANAIFGEVLVKRFTDGSWATFEMRLRMKEQNDYSFERYCPDYGNELPPYASVRQERLVDRQHPRRSAFDQTAVTRILPPIANAKEILRKAKFIPTIGTDYETPTARDNDNVVPANYAGHFIKDCRECHRDTLRSVTTFQEREWYGNLPGSAGIFSFWPFEPNDMLKANPRLRREFVEAGIVEMYDKNKHSKEDYQIAPEFENDPSPNPKITNAIVVGGSR